MVWSMKTKDIAEDGDASSKKRYQILNLPNQKMKKKCYDEKSESIIQWPHIHIIWRVLSLNNFNTDVSFKYGDN